MIKSILDFWNARTIKHQKKVADEVITKLRLIDRKAIVAGGAPRDWYFGNPAKDIDCYIYSRSNEQTVESLRILGFNIVSIKQIEEFNQEYTKCQYINQIVNVSYKGEDVQIMLWSIPLKNLVNSFPCSISKASYTPEGGINLDDEFVLGLAYNEVYLNRNYEDDNPYILKIKLKFPTWTFIKIEDDVVLLKKWLDKSSITDELIRSIR